MFNIFTGTDAKEIKSQDLDRKISGGQELLILDVRTTSEFRKDQINPKEGKILNYKPKKLLKDMPSDVEEQKSEREVIVVCYKGNISKKVASKLDDRLENEVKSLKKGMSGWRKI